MKDHKERGRRPSSTDAEPQSGPSRWSVSAIVMLGDSGIVGGQRPATQLRCTPLLAERVPEAGVDGDRVFVRDGAQVTSTESWAAIDLGLSLLDEELGRDVSLYVARRLVVFLRRPEDRSNLSVLLAAQAVTHGRLFNVQQYILSHPAADLSVAALAKIAAMSARNFTRVFRQELGVSPSFYVDLTRIDVARFLLEGSQLPIDTIAAKSGFGSARAMRRAFLAHLRTTPSDYRERFRSPGSGFNPNLSESG
jgi:transcriptional regulator GlxA family with amidase domain